MEQAIDSLRCPPSEALVKNLSGGEWEKQGGRDMQASNCRRQTAAAATTCSDDCLEGLAVMHFLSCPEVSLSEWC
jgi:hypothetical protein